MSNIEIIDNRYGAILLVLAALVFTVDVTVLRYLSPEVPFSLIIFFRSILQLFIVSIWIFLLPKVNFKSTRWKLLISRGVTSLICWWLYYLSFKKLDLALASTLTFTTSLFAVAMAPFILNEKIGYKRSFLTIFGFIGVLIASGLNNFSIDSGVLMGLGSAFAAAVLIFQNRILAKTEHTATIMFWIGLVATIGSIPNTIIEWTFISINDLLLLILAASLGTFGMLLTVEAYRFGEVSALAPFPYIRILFALCAGYFLFYETVTVYEFVGVLVICICGLIANEKKKSFYLQ